MIKLQISDRQYTRAEELYKFKVLKNSIKKGEGNIFGAIGEIMVNDYFIGKGANVDSNQTYDYDLIINGFKVDVKCKATNYEPKDYFNAVIPAYNPHQKCDFYFFTYVTYNFKICYLAGYKKKQDFFKESRLAKKGEIDAGNWKFKADTYVLQIADLIKFKQ